MGVLCDFATEIEEYSISILFLFYSCGTLKFVGKIQ